MEVWEVFQQKNHHEPFVHVGSVQAPDPEMAMGYAKECFFRRGEGKNLWVTKRTDVHELPDPHFLDQITDKSYRYPEAYRGVVGKREIAKAKAAAMTGRSAAPRSDGSMAGDEYESGS